MRKNNNVTLLVDKEIASGSWVSFHPMDNQYSTCIKEKGMLKIRNLVKDLLKKYYVVDFDKIKHD